MDVILFVMSLETSYLQIQLVGICAKYEVDASCNKNRQRNKLNRDRCLLNDVLRRTLVELIVDEDWSVLRNAIKLLQKSSLHQADLRKRYDQLKSSLKVITIQLMKKRQESDAKLRRSELHAAQLKDHIKDTMLNMTMQLNYVDKRLLARAESVDLEHRLEINLPPTTDSETRVHQQVIQIYELQTKEREELLIHWKNCYIKHIADINDRLKMQSDKLMEAVGRRTELQEKFDVHSGEMRAWLTFKQERSARLAREERSRQTATRIQAWWRGVMVRRGIGAFKQMRNAKKPPVKIKKKYISNRGN